MATGSMKRVDNIYFRCRKEAAKTNPALSSREATAELLNISVSSLANYELGITKCIPVDVIVRMSDLYKAPEIMNAYCANDCLIGKGQPIAVEITSIEKVVLRLLKTTDTIRRKCLFNFANGFLSPRIVTIANCVILVCPVQRLHHQWMYTGIVV